MSAMPQVTRCITGIVNGMSCASCATGIEHFLRGTPGVANALVNFSTKQVRIEFRDDVVTPSQLRQAIADHGYTLDATTEHRGAREGHRLRIVISGMSCTSCAAKIEQALRALDGVTDAAVNFATSQAVVVLDGCHASSVLDAIKALGYTARAADNDDVEDGGGAEATRDALAQTREIAEQRRGFFVSLIFTVPVVVLMIVDLAAKGIPSRGTWAIWILEAVFATPVVVIYGAPFFRRAATSARHLTFTMDTLIATGVGSMYIFSLVALALQAAATVQMNMYFDTAAMLLTFMLLGKFLEACAKRSTGDALIRLMDLAPKTATLITSAGDVVVPSAALQKGDRVRVLAGDCVPVDGVIVSGESDVDERMVTGESVPRTAHAGDAVVGGTTNLTAVLVVEATKVGEETMLSQILRIVSDAQNSKPAIQKIADSIASVFVPCVIGYSLVTLVVWLVLGIEDKYPAEWRDGQNSVAFAFSYFAATVVAACPCALGLATPTAVMVGTGLGAANGILIKSGETLELARKVDCVVFDKTGTITKGKLKVVAAHILHPRASAHTPAIVEAVEAQSTHPVAAAIASHLADMRATWGTVADGFSISSVTTHSGSGVAAEVVTAEGRRPCASAPSDSCGANALRLKRETRSSCRRCTAEDRRRFAPRSAGQWWQSLACRMRSRRRRRMWCTTCAAATGSR